MDSAVGEFGRALDAELSDVEGKSKQELKRKSTRVLQKWLDMPIKYRGPSRDQVAKPQ